MSDTVFEIRPGAYYDSVVLMQLQRSLASLPGVEDAGVVMATEANLDILAQSTLLPENAEADPEDLLIVVKASKKKIASEALEKVDELLARRSSTIVTQFRPRSMSAALKQLPEAQWVLISVPGRYAADVAREALDHHQNVFLYSDNVSLEDEITLKESARADGLLVMGPDCGTAIINGVGLGFANRVRRGSIGLVGASGTGLQSITSRIHSLGLGVSQAIGTGGRDLKSEVGGVTTLQGLDLLRRDPETELIVLVSKPPDPDVAVKVLEAARATGKPVVVNFIGYPFPARKLGNLRFASTLREAASLAVDWFGEEIEELPTVAPLRERDRRYLRGLFSGGTLASEAYRGLELLLGSVRTNLIAEEDSKDLNETGHLVLDLGEDEYTVGRLHPMMDNDLRIRLFRQAASGAEVGLILLDIVLGEGAHADPASDWAPAIAEVRRDHGVEVIVIFVGTDEDPQGYEDQIRKFKEAGAQVYEDITEAVLYVSQRLIVRETSESPEVPIEGFAASIAAINVGLEIFHESLIRQGAEAVQVDWRPPARGDAKLMSILEKMK